MKFPKLIFCLLAFALYGSNAMGAAVIIDDNFDDDVIGTNTLGTGNGFDTITQSDDVNPSTVIESGGNAILSTGPTCTYCISGITSKDSFDFFTANGARASWELSGLSGYDALDDHRPYLVVLRDDYQTFDERLNPHDSDAPGVYVDGIKIASVGLRIRRGSSFHGMALNVDVDLEPFSRINPCGFKGLELTDLARLGADNDLAVVREKLLPSLLRHLRMDHLLSSASRSGVPTSLQSPA